MSYLVEKSASLCYMKTLFSLRTGYRKNRSKGEILMAVALKFDMLALFAAIAFVGAIVFGAV